jgi:hypothetical protein
MRCQYLNAESFTLIPDLAASEGHCRYKNVTIMSESDTAYRN